jgi:hypothetical protein
VLSAKLETVRRLRPEHPLAVYDIAPAMKSTAIGIISCLFVCFVVENVFVFCVIVMQAFYGSTFFTHAANFSKKELFKTGKINKWAVPYGSFDNVCYIEPVCATSFNRVL